MARVKKDSVAITVKLDREIFELLSKFAEDSGQSKTIAVERAIKMYVDDYYEKMEKVSEK